MMRTSVALVLALVAGLFVAHPPTAIAQDDGAVAAAFYDDAVAAMGSQAAAALWNAVESARKAGLHAYSNAAAKETLRLDPEHARAQAARTCGR